MTISFDDLSGLIRSYNAWLNQTPAERAGFCPPHLTDLTIHELVAVLGDEYKTALRDGQPLPPLDPEYVHYRVLPRLNGG